MDMRVIGYEITLQVKSVISNSPTNMIFNESLINYGRIKTCAAILANKRQFVL